MLNPTTRNIFYIGLISAVALGLTALLIMMVPGHAHGQDPDNSTSTSSGMDTSTPSSESSATSTDESASDDDDEELIIVEECEEDVLTGALDCVERLAQPDGGVRGQSDTMSDEERKRRGLGPREGETIVLSGLGTNLSIGNSDSFSITGQNLLSNRAYTLEVSRTSGDTDVGFNSGCDSNRVSWSFGTGYTSISRGATLHACNAGGAYVTAKLLLGTQVIASQYQYVSVPTPPVPDSEISISGLVTEMEEGESDSFTVSASDMSSSYRYTIRVTVGDDDMGLKSLCTDLEDEVSVPLGRTSYSRTFTVYGCEIYGARITATLLRGSTTEDTDSQYVSVTASVNPMISISGLVSELEVGESDSFTVSLSDLSSSDIYTIEVATSDDDIRFNRSCTDVEENVSVPSGSTSYSRDFTVYGCDTSGSWVTARLKQGQITRDAYYFYVGVEEPEPDPMVELSGLADELEENDSDSFTIQASDLDSSYTYDLRVTSSNGDLGFDNSCSDLEEVFDIPSGQTSYSTSITVYGCDTSGARVTVTLRRGSTTEDSASQYVRVRDPQISISLLSSNLTEGGSDRFNVFASDLVASNDYTIKVSSNHSNLRFNSDCTLSSREGSPISGDLSITEQFTVHACETPGGTVTAQLLRDGTEIASDSMEVSVSPSTIIPSPEVSFTYSTSTLQVGQSYSFGVSASNLVAANNYTIRASVDDAQDLGFNSSCSADSPLDHNIPSNKSSYNWSFTLYGCQIDGGNVTVSLRRGTGTEDSSSVHVTVTNASTTPTPTIRIDGLAGTIQVGTDDDFDVVAENLDAGVSYSISVSTSNRNVGFGSSCSTTPQTNPTTIPSGRTSFTASSFMLRACGGNSGSVTVQLNGSSPAVTDTHTLRVLPASPAGQISIAGPSADVDEGATMRFMVSAPTGGHTIGISISGTASSGRDYTSPGSSVTLGDTETTKYVDIPILADTATEAYETVVVTLDRVISGNGVIDSANDTAMGQIRNTIVTFRVRDDSSTIHVVTVPNEETSRILLSLNTSQPPGIGSLIGEGSANRAYVINVKAREVAGSSAEEEARISSVITTPTITGANSIRHLQTGQVAWWESSSPPQTRYIFLSVSKPTSTGRISEYVITVSKPDLAFVTPVTQVGEDLSVTVRNSSEDSLGVLAEIWCGGYSNLGYRSTELRPIARATNASLTLCRGSHYSRNTPVNIVMKLHGTNSNNVQHALSNSVSWPFTRDTLWKSYRNPTGTPVVIGGVQIGSSTTATENAPECTSSFTLERHRPGSSSNVTTVSTTAHCTDRGHTWKQGPIPLNAALASVDSIATNPYVPGNLNCNLSGLGGPVTANCRKADQAFAGLSTSATTSIGQIFKPRIQNPEAEWYTWRREYFQEDSSDRKFRIVEARPPLSGDVFHKVGRTTGWTSGAVAEVPGTMDPHCIGNESGEMDNYLVHPVTGNMIIVECLVHTQILADGGDSGSPVFVQTDVSGTDDIEVVLVGVIIGGSNERGVFVPIDRIYAESILGGYDWSIDALKPLPVLDDPMESIATYSSDTLIIGTFDRAEVSRALGLRYEAGLFRVGTGDAETIVTGVNSSPLVWEVTESIPGAGFKFSDIASAQRGGEYRIRVRLCVDRDIGNPNSTWACGDYGSSGSKSIKIPPAPQMFEHQSVTTPSGSVRLQWTAVPGTRGYEFDYKQRNVDTEWQSVDRAVHSPTALITNLVCGATYDFIVRAYGNGSQYDLTWGFWSDTLSVMVPNCSASPPGNPTAQRSAESGGYATVRWDPIADVENVDHYLVDIPAAGYSATVSATSTQHRAPASALSGHKDELKANIWYCFDSGLCGLHQEVTVRFEDTTRGSRMRSSATDNVMPAGSASAFVHRFGNFTPAGIGARSNDAQVGGRSAPL